MRRYRNYREEIEVDRAALNAAFKAMRKEGLVAYQNFLCCSGCAGYEIASRVEKRLDEASASDAAFKAVKAGIKGCVFYHQQDADQLREKGSTYLAYGTIGTNKHGDIGLPTEEVGQIVKRCCEAAGLKVEWDGKAETRICIDATYQAPKPAPVAAWDGGMGISMQEVR